MYQITSRACRYVEAGETDKVQWFDDSMVRWSDAMDEEVMAEMPE